MQWSVAMQENEELRGQLYNTRNSLEQAGGGKGSGEHWRELCISIAKSAEDEKGTILEKIRVMREDLDKAGGLDQWVSALDAGASSAGGFGGTLLGSSLAHR